MSGTLDSLMRGPLTVTDVHSQICLSCSAKRHAVTRLSFSDRVDLYAVLMRCRGKSDSLIRNLEVFDELTSLNAVLLYDLLQGFVIQDS